MGDSRICGFCQERIRGRSDKKFCNDVCRNAFNNRINGELNASIRAINSKLKRNRRVLESLLPVDIPFVKLKKQVLLNKGFQMNYLTHARLSPKGSVYSFCYEYGYTTIGDEVVVVRKKMVEE
jgi:hypothetical protein